MLLPDNDSLQALKDLFGSMADITRLKILFCLLHKELCVCDISDLIEMSHSSVSHQLKFLRQCGLVKYEKKGKHVFYSLYDNHVKDLFSTGFEHINEKECAI